MPQSPKIAIVTCVNENWLAPACVTLLSVSRNLAATKADLFIVIDTLSEQGQKGLAEFERKHKITIKLIIHPPEVFTKLDAHRYSNATFMRLYLPQVIGPEYDRLLYLDSDVLAFSDLTSLLTCDLGGKALGAVPEVKMAPRRGVLTDQLRNKIGFPKNQDYFNAGVLLFDWPQTCAKDLLGKTRALLHSGVQFKFFDQDALNLVFQDDWKALPLTWNVEQSAACYLGVEPSLRHFNHAAKPWYWKNIMGYAPYHKYYVDALNGLALSAFLQQPKRGNPLFASAEYYFRKASLHQRRFLMKRYKQLL